MRVALVFVILSQLMFSLASAEARIAYNHKIRISSYPVFGDSVVELTKGMLTNGPVSHSGERHYAYTLWEFRIGRNRFEILAETARASQLLCRISLNLPFAKIKIGDLSKKWDKFEKALVAHENIHIKQAMRLCYNLKSVKVNPARLQAYSRRLKLRDIKLDKESQHGKLTGVTLAYKE